MGALGATLVPSLSAQGAELSQEALVHRCYQQFSRNRPRLDEEARRRLENGPTAYVELCMELLDSAQFPSGSSILSPEQQQNPIALSVLRTWNQFHNSFFPENDALLVEDFGQYTHNLQTLEFGHYFTRALFTPGLGFESSITSSQSLEPARAGPQSTVMPHPLAAGQLHSGAIYGASTRNSSNELLVSTTWQPQVLPSGPLIGVVPAPAKVIPGAVYNLKSRKAEVLNFNINQNFGVGLLGDPMYLLLNSGAGFGNVPDGGLKTHRRFSERFFRNILCRDLPVIRISDVAASEIIPGSSISFQAMRNCMHCHASMESLSGNVARVAIVRSAKEAPIYPNINTMHVVDRRLDGSSSAAYAYQDHAGRLRFRTINGELVDQQVNGLAQLAQAISTREDFAACVAKRYYKFLTGTDVALYDPGDPNAPSVSSTERPHYDFVRLLGRDLLRHHDLRTLVEQILSSPFYRRKQ